MTPIAIPFNRVVPVGRELDYVRQAIANGHVSGDGPFTRACEQLLETALGVPRVLLTTSCTHAIEMAALLLNVQPGDEVILPSFTFVSTANAFALRGARPIFVDIRDDTLNLDERLLERAITPRTRAIVVMHYAGVPCEMEAIESLAADHGLPVVEDNAHGLFGNHRGRTLGAIGGLAALSFHETKNVSCGEGGALIVNDSALRDRAEILRQKGTNRSRFLRGEVDRYTWVDIGSSFVMSDLLAAFLLAQLEAGQMIQAQRQAAFERYQRGLGAWAAASNVRLLPAHVEHPYHMYYLRFANGGVRNHVIEQLRRRGIVAVSHYEPLHLSAMGRQFGYQPGDLPVTEAAAAGLLRLPFFRTITEEEQATVIRDVIDVGELAEQRRA